MTVVFGRRAWDLFTSTTMNYHATVAGDTITVHDDVALGGDALSTVAFLTFLQTCVTQGVAVHWRCQVAGPLDTAALHHLWPPVTMRGAPAEEHHSWRDSFRYGLCYFRQGPGFILVKDARDACRPARLVIDHPDLVESFLAGVRPQPCGALSAVQREAADVLVAEGIASRFGDLLLTLPTRMHRWPVPFSAV